MKDIRIILNDTILVCVILTLGFQLASIIPTYSDYMNNKAEPVSCEKEI